MHQFESIYYLSCGPFNFIENTCMHVNVRILIPGIFHQIQLFYLTFFLDKICIFITIHVTLKVNMDFVYIKHLLVSSCGTKCTSITVPCL